MKKESHNNNMKYTLAKFAKKQLINKSFHFFFESVFGCLNDVVARHGQGFTGLLKRYFGK